MKEEILTKYYFFFLKLEKYLKFLKFLASKLDLNEFDTAYNCLPTRQPGLPQINYVI